MTFASKHIHEKVNLQKAVIAAGGAKARFLYILHSGCWVPRKETEIGTITVHTGNNSSYKIFSGRDLADWWNPASLPNALVALRKENKSSSVGMYVSKFKIADELTAVQDITIETSGEAIWIIAAATLSSQDLPITGAGKWSPAAGTQWKAVDLSDLIIKENSALDFSSQVEAGPAGKYGRAIVNQNGRMVFEKKTDQEIRFFSCGLIWRDLARLQNNDEAAKLAGLIRRQGYNMVRLHFLDSYLMLDAKDDFAFNPVNYDRFQYFFKALKDNGIYVYLDAMTSWSGYSKESAWSKAGKDLDFKRRIFIDEKTRQHWIKGVSGFLTDVNPYTKTALKDDTAVVCILFFNEVFHPHIVEGFTGEYLPVWQKFLQQKYGSVEKLRSIWIDDQGHELCSAASFSEIPMFEKKHFWDRSPICIDLGLFCEYLTTDMINFWTAEIRKMGYNGLVSVYDSIKNFSHCAVRNNIPAVSMHGYHAHPTGFTQKDSGISQSSSIPGGVRYFTSILGQRYLDRPFIVTEYNHAFWNKYRHETGLVSGSYASLHDIDGMLGFTSPAIFNADVPMNSFSAGHDPVMRGNEVIAGYLYRTRAVKPSPKIIQLYLDHEYIFEKGNAMRTVGTDQLLLALLARFGLYYEKGSPFSIKGPAADLVLRPAGTGKIEGGMGAVHIESSEADTNFLPAVIKTMKEKGIIPENNPTDSAAGIYASGTGEIMLSENSKGIKVITERAEGISLGIPKAVKLSVLEITALGQNSSATLLSLDLKPLSRSERMLLVFETDALNSESVYTSDYRDRLVENGKLPVLIKTGRISLAINNSRADVMRLFALSFNGERKEELPVKKNSGRLEAEIDTSRLKNGPAVFFEIAAE
ncbi:MAG TPA: hypothetical protein DC049_20035 [Spirochaetia bacterium]|nr:hypothetical protein [Spirochaetia bacterium]